jgi:hypothetical protein
MAEAPVSSELKSMVSGGKAAPAQTGVNKILAASTAVLSAVVVCLSIAVARTSDNKAIEKDIIVSVTDLPTRTGPAGNNICVDTNPGLANIQCIIDAIGGEEGAVNASRFFLGTAEQSGANVTEGYQGDLEVTSVPITDPYWEAGLCPVNVHWHLGSEHLSVGEYDEAGVGPTDAHSADDGHADDAHRNLAGAARPGYQCHHYDDTKPKFTKEYDWKYCENMHVGETYEVHWPHSNMGACGTPNQYQSPFYDGVFCRFATDFGGALTNAKIGVQAQVFSIVNDEAYYYPDLIHGMVVDGEMGVDIAKYTGSTTGTSRDNEVCSQYTGVTWQVDRKCHMISASSFDKLCADMKSQRDDMSEDFYPHGSRELVDDSLAANNHQNRKLRGN